MSKIDKIFEELGFKGPPLLSHYSRPQHRNSHDFPTGPCGKKVYPSERVAKDAIHNRQQKGTGGATSLLAYHCKQCGGFHMSSRGGGPQFK